MDAETREMLELLLKRFDDVDARFDGVDMRFNAVDARFDRVDARFDLVDARFDRVDARFDLVDARFDRVDARIGSLEDRLDAMGGPPRRAARSSRPRYRGREVSMVDEHIEMLSALNRAICERASERAKYFDAQRETLRALTNERVQQIAAAFDGIHASMREIREVLERRADRLEAQRRGR
jgi:hypothetical protein